MAKVKLNMVRVAFPDLFEATQFEEGKGPKNYRATFLVEPNSDNHKAVVNAMQEVAKEEFKDKAAVTLKAASEDSKLRLLVDGNSKTYDGYAGMLALSATRNMEKGRPLVLNNDKTPLTQVDGKPYAGCYVNATVELWAQNNRYGKCVRAQLLAVQFAKDGDAFGGGNSKSSADEFEDLSTADDINDLVS